jgi:hypothetical protein
MVESFLASVLRVLKRPLISDEVNKTPLAPRVDWSQRVIPVSEYESIDKHGGRMVVPPRTGLRLVSVNGEVNESLDQRGNS